MKRSFMLPLLASVGLIAGLAQRSALAAPKTQDPPAAYVYVSGSYGGNSGFKIAAFSAARNGALTPIAGSPFAGDVSAMAVNGKYLLGAGNDGFDVYSFGITWDGGLVKVQTTNVQTYNPGGCPGLGPIVFDHSGASLYVSTLEGGSCDSGAYQSFAVEKPTGKLKFLGITTSAFLYNSPLSFTGSNKFAYGTDCIDYQGNYLDTFSGFRRQTDGLLVNGSGAPTPPADSGEFYCRDLTAADRTNHLAVSLLAIDQVTQTPVGPPVLATYTADAQGNLHTSSTTKNMPATDVGSVTFMAMSPSGKLLAVGGANGLQVFHFNEDDPITHYTGLLTTDSINQTTPSPTVIYWDNDDHLYAVSAATGKLFVFTVTPTSVTQAPGSPYAIPGGQNLIVQPRTELDPWQKPANSND